MYSVLLYLHSYNRWVLLFSALLALVLTFIGVLKKQSPGSRHERIASLVFLISVDVQFLVGILLYAFYSPFVRTAFADMRSAMKEPVLRFYAVEHFTLGLLALILVHTGNVLARRAQQETRARKLRLLFFSLTLLVVLLAIPWPFREQIARPLWR